MAVVPRTQSKLCLFHTSQAMFMSQTPHVLANAEQKTSVPRQRQQARSGEYHTMSLKGEMWD